MSTTLLIDSSGGAVIPPALLQMLGLKPGGRLQADVSPQGIALKPVAGEDICDEDKANGLRLVRKGRGLVITGGEPFDAVEAIQAARDERDEMILSHRNQAS
jgi:bifunctional DNA-binding transcriptional regulator/antitoxin component of YhaV-PrlF toxin-antitoxin module